MNGWNIADATYFTNQLINCYIFQLITDATYFTNQLINCYIFQLITYIIQLFSSDFIQMIAKRIEHVHKIFINVSFIK